MTYDVKCPSCGLLHTLQESDLGNKLACAQCGSEWVFDEPLKRRKAAEEAVRAAQKHKRSVAKRAEREEAQVQREAEKRKRAQEEREQDHKTAVALTQRRATALTQQRATMKTPIGKQPEYAILEVASWCCYVLSGLSTLALIIMLFDGDKTAPLLGLQLGLPDRFIFAWLIVSIVYVATSGAVIAAFRDIAINSWKSVNKE